MTLYEAKQNIKIGGKYRHFEGGIYTVDSIGIDFESLIKPMVCIHDKDGAIFFTDADEFIPMVDTQGIITRFELVD